MYRGITPGLKPAEVARRLLSHQLTVDRTGGQLGGHVGSGWVKLKNEGQVYQERVPPVDSLRYCSGGAIYARLQIVQWVRAEW